MGYLCIICTLPRIKLGRITVTKGNATNKIIELTITDILHY